VSVFVFQLGAHTAAEYWVRGAEIVKMHLLQKNAEKQKVLFIGGSSVWMGIDSDLAGEALGARAVNVGLHAMIPLDHIIKMVGPVLRAGDVVILPLEFEYYVIDTPYNTWFLNQVMAEDPEWFWRLPWQEKARFIISVPPVRVLEGTLTKLFSDRLDVMNKRHLEQDPEEILAAARRSWKDGSLPDVNYTFRNIDEDGDAIVTKGSFAAYNYLIDRDSVARTYPWKTLDSFAKYCAAHRVGLYIVWPPVVKNMVRFDSRLARRNIQAIMQELAEIGIPVLGHPADFQYDRRLFADSGYHLTHEGRTLHTQHVLRLLRQKMGDNHPSFMRRSYEGRCSRPALLHWDVTSKSLITSELSPRFDASAVENGARLARIIQAARFRNPLSHILASIGRSSLTPESE
jgi:hypothetical protein